MPQDLLGVRKQGCPKFLQAKQRVICAENERDKHEAEANGLSASLAKRLALDETKLDQLTDSVKKVAGLEDPVGKNLLRRELDRGLVLHKVSVPIGVVGVIFESRPDVLVQVSSLCLKSGNAAILKGGSEAFSTSKVLFEAVYEALESTSPVFQDCLQLVSTREDVKTLLEMDKYVDLIIPRGSAKLVSWIQANTRIPVLGHSEGVCHLYIDREADLELAVKLTYDAKCQYPAVCNAIETLLVDRSIAQRFLPAMAEALRGVELRADAPAREIISATAATDSDWTSEYNDLILSVRMVSGAKEAIEHINRFGSRHTDAIVTANEVTASEFMDGVDSGSVMWNCSTRFADGYRYGFGAEVGIATGKLHARGPVGLDGLTTFKYKLVGHGQIVADYVEGKRAFRHKDLSP